jgi:hypothetical protein
MDRKSVFILVVCFILFMVWAQMVQRFIRPSRSRAPTPSDNPRLARISQQCGALAQRPIRGAPKPAGFWSDQRRRPLHLHVAWRRRRWNC